MRKGRIVKEEGEQQQQRCTTCLSLDLDSICCAVNSKRAFLHNLKGKDSCYMQYFSLHKHVQFLECFDIPLRLRNQIY